MNGPGSIDLNNCDFFFPPEKDWNIRFQGEDTSKNYNDEKL
jgi:hypothetical protein